MSESLEQQTAASLESIAESAASIRRDIAVSVWAFVWLPLIGAAAVAVVRLVGAYRKRRRMQ